MGKIQIGICKVKSNGQICHRNSYARQMCEIPEGGICKLFEDYLSQPRSGLGEFLLPEVVYYSKEHVAAIAMKVDDGFRIYFRSIENEPTFKDILPKGELVSLTRTEALVLEKLFLKKTNQEIAESLFISLATLKTHIAHLYQKIPKLKEWRNRGIASRSEFDNISL